MWLGCTFPGSPSLSWHHTCYITGRFIKGQRQNTERRVRPSSKVLSRKRKRSILIRPMCKWLSFTDVLLAEGFQLRRIGSTPIVNVHLVFKRVWKHKDEYKGKFPSVFHSGSRFECSVQRDMRRREMKAGGGGGGGADLSCVASFFDCESLHRTFAQGLDVVQETGGGQNVGGPWNQSIKKY